MNVFFYRNTKMCLASTEENARDEVASLLISWDESFIENDEDFFLHKLLQMATQEAHSNSLAGILKK